MEIVARDSKKLIEYFILIFFFNTGDVLKLFAAAMTIGVVTGTFSSLYIAGALVVEWNHKWPIDPKLVITGKKGAR